MKFPSLFTKTPDHRKFSFTPRHYDSKEEERIEREERIRKELKKEEEEEELASHSDYRSRISGSFKSARRTASRQKSPSSSLIRLMILTFLTLWLFAYLQFGNVAFYGLLLFIPFYLFLKSRETKN